MTYQTIRIEKRQKGVAWLIVDHPPVNAIGEKLMKDLVAAADDLTQDDSVRVVVIASANPKIFLAGADLKGVIQESGEEPQEDNLIKRQSQKMQACFNRFAEMPKPVIAAINGHALGGGCELALACDFRFMGTGKIGLTELSLGLLPGAGGTQRLTRLLGRPKAIELIFTAKKLEAKEALELDLIHRAVDPLELEAEVTKFARQLAEGAIHSMGLAKRAINAAEGPIDEGFEVEAQAFADTFLTEEPGIGLAAFFMREKPRFLS